MMERMEKEMTKEMRTEATDIMLEDMNKGRRSGGDAE